MSDLPIVGATFTLDEIEAFRPWLLEKQRDLELQDLFVPDILDRDPSPVIDQAKKVLDGYTGRLGIHGPAWGFQLDCHDPEIRAVIKKRMNQALDLCQAIGATQMVIHSPYMFWHHNNIDKMEGERAAFVERVHACIGDAVARAGDIGCTLVLENIEDIDPHVRVMLADSFGSAAIAVSVDTGHAHYAHHWAGAPPVDYYVRAAGERLQHVHLQDVDGFADRHWPLGDGTIPWVAVFEALGRLDAKPRLIVEIFDKSRVEASVEYLAALGLAR